MFDGASFVLDADCDLKVQAPDWREALVKTEWRRGADGSWRPEKGALVPPTEEPAAIYRAMVLGLGDYVRKNKFPGVVLGLSGGIDSALSAAVAVDALGADKVHCVMMPSRYTSRDKPRRRRRGGAAARRRSPDHRYRAGGGRVRRHAGAVLRRARQATSPRKTCNPARAASR